MGEFGLSREEFHYALETLQKTMDQGFLDVNRRLDTMNGQVRTHGETIAVLKDRDARDQTARVTGVMGILTAVVTFLYQHFLAAK